MLPDNPPTVWVVLRGAGDLHRYVHVVLPWTFAPEIARTVKIDAKLVRISPNLEPPHLLVKPFAVHVWCSKRQVPNTLVIATPRQLGVQFVKIV